MTLISLFLLFCIPCILGLCVLSLLRPTFPSLSLIEIPGIAFSFGLCALVIPCTAGYLLNGSLFIFISAGLLIASLICIKQRNSLQTLLKAGLCEPQNWLLWVVLIGLSIHAYFLGIHLVLTTDSILFLSYIQKFLSSQSLRIENFHLSATSPIDEIFAPYVYNIVFPLFAFVSKITKINHILLWKYSSSIFTFITFSTFYSASIRFFNSSSAAILSLLFILLYWTLPQDHLCYGIWALKSLAYPNQMGALSFITLISFIYQELRLFHNQRGSSKNLIIYIALGGFLPFLHLQWWVYFVCVNSIFFILTVWASKRNIYKPLFLGFIAFFSISASLLALKLHYHVQGGISPLDLVVVNHLIFKVFNLYLFNPLRVFRPFTLIIFILIFLILMKKRKKLGKELSQPLTSPSITLFILCSFLAIFIISPIAINIAAKFLTTYIVARMTWVVDMFLILICGYLITETISFSQVLKKVGGISKTTFFSLLLFCMGGVSIIFPSSIINYRIYAPHSLSEIDYSIEPLITSKDFQELMSKIKQKSVLLSRRIYGTNEFFLIFSDSLTTYPSYKGRKEDGALYEFIDQIFTNKISPEEILKILSQLPCDYIILRPHESQNLATQLDNLKPFLVKLFDKEIKELCIRDCRFILYKVNHDALKKYKKEPPLQQTLAPSE